MSVGWTAGSVRARAMTRRRLGSRAARALAGSGSLAVAIEELAGSPYGHDIRAGQSLGEAQRAVTRTAVWNVRVLAGWVPREGVTVLRTLLGAVEISNVEDLVLRLGGDPIPAPYELGGLSTAWTRLAGCASVDEVCAVLGGSAWGDPGDRTPRAIGLAMRATLADRVISAVPAAAAWAGGAAALLVAREVVLGHRELPERARLSASRVVGPAAVSATALPSLRAALPTNARWALDDVGDPDELWRAEARWWGRVERDAFALARRATAGPEVLVGAVAMLAADAWRVRAALEIAARGGAPTEVFDAVA